MIVSYGKQILGVLDSGIFGASLSAASNTSPTHDGQKQRHQTAKVRFTLRSLKTKILTRTWDETVRGVEHVALVLE